MSYTYTAHTIVGLLLPADKVLTMALVKTHDHEFPESVRFDASSGKPLWEEVPSSVFVDEPGYDFEGHEGLPKDYSVTMMHSERNWCKTVIVGTHLGSSWGEGTPELYRPDGDFMAQVQKILQPILEEHGLWDESKFGIYTACV